MRSRTLLALATVGVLAVACGGRAAPHAAAPVSATRTPAATGTAPVKAGTTAAPQATAAQGAAAKGGGASSAGKTPPSAAPTPTATGPADHREIPLDAALSAACVTPGGSQTITIHGDPYWGVVFDTRYPDGKDGQTYGGIDYRGNTGASGTYVMTWAVSVAAPVGDADVEAGAVGQGVTAHKRLPFKIALRCP
jgi:hypothetical protein